MKRYLFLMPVILPQPERSPTRKPPRLQSSGCTGAGGSVIQSPADVRRGES
jgi:hypothetical protein